jgi:hypothetical protein
MGRLALRQLMNAIEAIALIPGKKFCSTFLLERLSEDLLKNSERIYFG